MIFSNCWYRGFAGPNRLTLLRGSFYPLAAALLGILGAAPTLRAGTVNATPPYAFTESDPVWQQVGSTDEFRAPESAYDFVNEIYELPVKGDTWTISGGFISTTDKYYEYIDMEEGRWGADACFLYVSWETAGSRIHTPGGTGFEAHGYQGHYYAYFGVPDGNDLVIEIPGGKADILTTTFTNQVGNIKVFEDANDAIVASGAGNDVPGPGGGVSQISMTGQSGSDGFDTEVSLSAGDLLARRNGDVVEVALKLSSAVDLSATEIIGMEYMYIGVAETNPSGVGDLFSNDHFSENVPTNTVEYDNVMLGVPEPVSGVLVTFGVAWLAFLMRTNRQ